MKKLIALLILVSAVSAWSYGVDLMSQYPNMDARGDNYWAGYDYWTKDYVHGQPGNPYNNVPDGTPGQFTNPKIQLDDQGTFMWQTGNLLQRPRDLMDQFYYLENCDWMDLPEYVGCTEYFMLFIYKPLTINCVCQTYKCLGIYSIPSHHDFVGTSNNPFNLGAPNFWCTWTIQGQENWYVQLSGEILENPVDPNVIISWYWEAAQSDVVPAGLGTNGWNPVGVNWTQQIQLSPAGLYYVGLAATAVQINMGALSGLHTYDATVSGYYSL